MSRDIKHRIENEMKPVEEQSLNIYTLSKIAETDITSDCSRVTL